MQSSGSGSMRRHRRSSRPVAEINLTSLLDVAFVLLIAFMIVAPSLKYGVEVDLPSMKQGAPQLSNDQQNLATVTLSKKIWGTDPAQAHHMYMLDGKAVELDELESQLVARNKIAEGKLAVEMQADRDIPYDAFVQAVGALRRAGIQQVSLPVDIAGH